MRSTLQAPQGPETPAVDSALDAEHKATWVARTPAVRARAPLEGEPCVYQLSREMECLRAACVSAGLLRRWWLRRRLRAVMREKTALEQHWRKKAAGRRR